MDNSAYYFDSVNNGSDIAQKKEAKRVVFKFSVKAKFLNERKD